MLIKDYLFNFLEVKKDIKKFVCILFLLTFWEKIVKYKIIRRKFRRVYMLNKLLNMKNGFFYVPVIDRNNKKSLKRLRLKTKITEKEKYERFKKVHKIGSAVLSLCITWNAAIIASAIYNNSTNNPMVPTAGKVTNFGTALDKTFGGVKNVGRKGDVIIAVIDRYGSNSKLPKSDSIIKTPGLEIDGQDSSTHGVVVVTDEVYGRVQKLKRDIANKIKIMPINLESDYFFQDIPYSIVYAANSGAKVISLSLGSAYINDKYIERMQGAIDYAHQKGAIVVAAAGNDGEGKEFYPAQLNNVVAVSAVKGKDMAGGYYYTSYANANEKIDFAAFEGRYKGTSLTAPQVAVQIAAISEKLLAEGIEAEPDRVIEIASNTADHDIEGKRTPKVGWGLINLDRAFLNIENKNIPNVKDIEPPHAVQFRYDCDKSLTSFKIIDDKNKVDTSRLNVILEGSRADGKTFKTRILDYTENNGEITSKTEKLADGKYKLTAVGARDTAGNEEKIVRSFDIDTKPVDVKYVASLGEKGKSLDYDVQIKDDFGFQQCILINGKVVNYAEFKIDGNNSFNKFMKDTYANKNTIDISKFSEGNNSFQILASDNTFSQIITFIVVKKNGKLISIKEMEKEQIKSNKIEEVLYGNKNKSGLEFQKALLKNLFNSLARITKRNLS